MYKIFETKNKNYIFDTNSSLIFEVNPEYKQLFKNINKNKSISKTKYPEIYDLMKEGKKLNSDFQEYLNLNNNHINSISLILTNECNLKCSYCYNYNNNFIIKKMKSDIAKNAVDFLVENSTSKNLTIIFFGGEPLLNKKTIIDVVNYCKIIEKKKNRKFYYSITTNATLLDDDIKKFMIKNKFHFNISIDGDKRTHDLCRKYSSGLASYENVIKGIENIPKELRTARVTVTKMNLDTYSMYKNLSKIGFRNIHFEMVTTNLNEYKLSKNDIDELISSHKKICDDIFLKVSNKKNNRNLEFSYGQLEDDLKKIDNQTFRGYFCKAAKSYLCIDTDGSIYPCHRYIGDKKYIIGHIKSGFLEKRNSYIKCTVFNKTECEKCWAKFLCGGGCYQESEIINKDLYIPYENKCYFIKGILRESIFFYLRLKENGIDDISFMYS